MSHTPGPWSIHETKGNGGNISDRVEIAGPEEGRRKHLVASIYGFKLPEGQANARLIAAAPEMFEACTLAMDVMNNEDATGLDLYECRLILTRACTLPKLP